MSKSNSKKASRVKDPVARFYQNPSEGDRFYPFPLKTGGKKSQLFSKDFVRPEGMRDDAHILFDDGTRVDLEHKTTFSGDYSSLLKSLTEGEKEAKKHFKSDKK